MKHPDKAQVMLLENLRIISEHRRRSLAADHYRFVCLFVCLFFACMFAAIDIGYVLYNVTREFESEKYIFDIYFDFS